MKPRNVLAVVQGSSNFASPVKYRTTAMHPKSGSQVRMKNIRVPVNLARTTCRSLTGVVIRVSYVPVPFSKAKERMVMTGGVSSMMTHR